MSDLAQDKQALKARMIVGLGNPGARYRDTRHNLGFQVVGHLAARWELRLENLECNALIAEKSGVLLVTPQTYMNRSGYAVRCLVQRRDCEAEDLLVVYDDVELALGRLRLRPMGGPGGHRGMESIVRSLQSHAIPRLRLGVGPLESGLEGEDLVEYVLSPFAAEESKEVLDLVEKAADACESWLRSGPESTMNRFNG